MVDCCEHTAKAKKCTRKKDKKVFTLPRRFSRETCLKKIAGFTMRSSCAPYKGCKKGGGNSVFYLSGGCFWHVQKQYDKLKGVKETEVGYMGGKKTNPTYKVVSSGTTNYAETVKVKYDEQTDFRRLVKYGLKIHDPTSINRQGLDIGKQYRSIFYYSNNLERSIIAQEISLYEKKAKKPVASQILSTKNYKFHRAEEYHQKYSMKKECTPLTEDINVYNKICIHNRNLAEKKFTGKYLDPIYLKKKGKFVCPCCKNNLYHTRDMYDSGSGWPAFSNTYDRLGQRSKNVTYLLKNKELRCRKCNIHLGHRTFDGPTNSKIHDCINSACLHFIPKKLGGGKTKFLYNPNNPKKSFDVYIDKNPKDTISIQYKTLTDVKNTIRKLEKLYKSGKYSHKRIWQVGMIMKVRLEVIQKMKKKQYKLSKRYYEFLKKRTKVKSDKGRKMMIFKL